MKLMPLFIIFTLLEIALLVELGRFFGTFDIIVWLVISATLGWLVIQNTQVSWRHKIKADILAGQMPTGNLFQTLLLLLAGGLLILPGVLTDLLGLLLLLPLTRKIIAQRARQWVHSLITFSLPFYRR